MVVTLNLTIKLVLALPNSTPPQTIMVRHLIKGRYLVPLFADRKFSYGYRTLK